MESFRGIIRTKSPLSHNSDESLGVDTKFRRISVITDNGKVERIPVYSGNAFRGILRRIGAKHLCDTLGLKEISDKLYYALFSGGGLQKGSSQNYIEVGKIREMRKKVPFLSIFGTAFQNQITQGKLKIGMLIPVSKETQQITEESSTTSVWELTEEIFYTRKDDKEDAEKKEQAHQMKYSIECIIPGTKFYQRIDIESEDPVEIGCLSNAMNILIEKGKLGGKSGVGHGEVSFLYSPKLPSPKPYIDFIEKEKEEIVEYIRMIENAL